MKRILCWLIDHNTKDKGWGIVSCRRCGDRLRQPLR